MHSHISIRIESEETNISSSGLKACSLEQADTRSNHCRTIRTVPSALRLVRVVFPRTMGKFEGLVTI